ncbi:M56 family metallopeptidase [Prosthecobacter fluviatilis]|uniref:M56 family metallopeptidase n=1 Tax=Prosthecobacter fluviatilis TaxID=445931 RepID=A0ABW0KUQ8_9BACT
MNLETLLSFTPGWLLDVGLQMTALLALAGGVVVCVRGMAAAKRHFILASALMLIPVVMGCSFIAPVWRISWEAGREAMTAEEVAKKEIAEGRDPFAPRLAATVTLKASVLDEVAVSPLWAVLWLGGVAAGAVVLGGSAWALRRLRRESHMVVDAGMRRCFAEEAGALNLELPVACLRMSAACAVPMTWGISQKTVLLPVEAAGWEEKRLRLVLRHELAHIARGDVLVTLLTTVCALLLWPHPLVWAVLRACGRAREQACDDVALERSGGNADDFAKELLEAVAGLGCTGRPWLPLALAMSVSANARALRGRLASLVQAGRGRGGYSLMQKLVLMLPAMAGAFVLAGLTACRKAEPEVPKQILVRSRFVSIPKDSPVLAEAGLTLDGSNEGMQNLGIRTMEQTQELLRKVSQQKGVELMSTPSVTTKSGARATVEVMREFIYPTEFDPPRPATEGKPLIPTTPTVFQMKPVGVRMDVTPTLLEDGNIALEATPEATSFEGYLEYGKPITQGDKVVSENKIQQPIFHTMKTTASFVMKPGQSVVFGGLGGPDATPLTSRMPKTKDLVFFIIEASVVDAAEKAAMERSKPEPAVSVFGPVKRQGRYLFKKGMTVRDLLEQAQGLSERADGKWAELRRGNQGVMIDLEKDGGKALEAEDAVTVKEK